MEQPNALRRAWRSLTSWLEPRWWMGSPGPVNPVCDVSGYLTGGSEALGLASVIRCVSVYTDALSALPRRVVRRTDAGGLEVDALSDGARTLAGLPAFDLECLAAAVIVDGNGYLECGRNSRGGADSLRWIPSARVTPGLDERGRLYYRVSRDDSLAEPERVLSSADVAHIRYRGIGTQNRLVGVSPLQTGSAAVQMALRALQFQAEVLRNAQAPSTVLSAPSKISKELADRIRLDWSQNFGSPNRGRTLVAGEGLTVAPFAIGTAIDAELSKQFEFSVAEIGRLLGVPLALLGQPGNLTAGVAQSELASFAAVSLAPFARRFEEELTRTVLTDAQQAGTWRCEFDLSALLVNPSDIPARLSTLVNGGVLTPNEARNSIGLGDVEGYGDLLRIPVNTTTPERWLAATTPVQQPAHDAVPANPQPEASALRSTLRAV